MVIARTPRQKLRTQKHKKWQIIIRESRFWFTHKFVEKKKMNDLSKQKNRKLKYIDELQDFGESKLFTQKKRNRNSFSSNIINSCQQQ